jgi:hypothetical protein
MILVIAVFIAGCSVLRKEKADVIKPKEEYLNINDKILALNITNRDFNIPKAEIEVFSNGERKRLFAFMKYRKPGNYLISVKSRTGIEAARIFVTKDSLLINDRVNRKLYCGSREFLLSKYGISANALPLLTGDFIYNYEKDTVLIKCINGKSEINGQLQTKKIGYSVDCDKAKVKSARISNEDNSEGIELDFGEFRVSDKNIYPGIIQIQDFDKETSIKIKITSIEFNIIYTRKEL